MLILERAPSFVASRWNTELREKLFECYVNFSTSNELSDWLRELGCESISKRGQLGRLSGEWPINCCATERGVPSIEHTSQVVVEHARPDS